MNQAWPLGVIITIVVSALASICWLLYGLAIGASVYLVAAYIVLAFLVGLDLVTVPSGKLPILSSLDESERRAYKRYNSFIMFPFAGTIFSATLSVLRLGSVAWAMVALFGKAWFLGVMLGLFGLFSTPMIVRFSPLFNLRPLATRGDADALRDLKTLERVLAKRESSNLEVS